MMLSQHVVHQPITGLGDDIIPEYNAANLNQEQLEISIVP